MEFTSGLRDTFEMLITCRCAGKPVPESLAGAWIERL
jgi:hypothetical protein